MIYAEDLDEKTLKQWEEAIDQPFVISSALMADAHLGYTLPIGGVVATKDYIVPSWVGYDIGCGVLGIMIDADVEELKSNSEAIYYRVQRDIPVGFKHHKHRQANDQLIKMDLSVPKVQAIWDKKGGTKQLGTLGGGNHFIEIGSVGKQACIIIHSGSRGIGHGIASHYIRLAHPKTMLGEGSFALKAAGEYGKNYLNDLKVCTSFAFDNRLTIANDVVNCISKVIGKPVKADVANMINRTHNHVKLKDGLYIHRKGATHAEYGMAGIIPGNMRDGSYIVNGLGNPESLSSASHGAGRKYGRKAAKRELSLDKFSRDMVGVTAKVCLSTLDESPDAYKNINMVLALQDDLIKVVAHVKPIINIKG